MAKTISVCIPCYNEQDNIAPLYEAIQKEFKEELPEYNYEIQFIDNHSTDRTREEILILCKNHKNVKAIFNAKNFPNESGYYGIIQTGGDCTVSIPADFQLPISKIHEFVKEWEKGYKIVCAIKESSKESGLMWRIRQFYYRQLKRFSNTDVIQNFSGCGLYDRSFLDLCRQIDDPIVSFGQIIATLGTDVTKVYYDEEKRKSGKSKESLFTLFDKAIMRFISYSDLVPRFAIFAGIIMGIISVAIAVTYFILKMVYWNMFPAGMIPAVLGIFFIGSLQLFFLGMIGEYIIKINKRLMKRPLVVEERRINFEHTENEK